MEEQWTTVRTKRFKEWFGDWENDPENASKVVDENGEPLVVYHGTAYELGIKLEKDDVAELKKAFTENFVPVYKSILPLLDPVLMSNFKFSDTGLFAVYERTPTPNPYDVLLFSVTLKRPVIL